MTERWGALPLGEIHPRDRCHRCGAKASYGYHDSSRVTVRLVTVRSTLSHALECADVIACERRRYNNWIRQQELNHGINPHSGPNRAWV